MRRRSAKARLPAPFDTPTPILVLRQSFAPLQHAVLDVARSAGRWGIPVHAVRMGPGETATGSRYIRQTLDPPTDGRWLETLARFADRSGGGVLLPIDDESSVFVDDNHAVLAESFLLPKAPAGIHRLLASKRAVWEACRRLGVDVPESRFPADEDELVAIGRDFGYPLVLKRSDAWVPPRDANAPSVLIAHSEDALLAGFRRMAAIEQDARDSDPHVIAQEYIPGEPDSIWMFNGYFGRDSKCLCAFTGQKLRQRGPRTGPTTLGVCRWNERVSTAAIKLLGSLGYQGIVDMGLRHDARDDRYKVLDINPRMGSTFRLFTGVGGLDVVRAAYLDLTGLPVPTDHAREGRKWIVEPYDLFTCLQLARERSLGLGEWAGSLRDVEEGAWWAADDPLPFVRMCAAVVSLGARYRRRRSARANAAEIHSLETVASASR